MRTTKRIVTAVFAVALLAAACGEAPEEEGGADPAASEESEASGSASGTESDEAASESETTGSESETTTDESESEAPEEAASACLVTDTGGVDDRSFNETSYEGMLRAEEELGVEISLLESTSPADFEPNINTFVDQGCDLIVTVGFLLGEATAAAAQANPDTDFAIVDFDFFDADAGEDITYDNVRELTFATDQASFLAGFASASFTESGTVGTYGGINIPTVTIFMDGYLAGVQEHNEVNGTDVEVLGWDGESGTFTGDFESQENGRNVTEQFLANGADVVMPVAGPVGLGTTAAVSDAVESGEENLAVVWVDNDGFESVPQFQSLFLTSVLKNTNNAVFDTIQAKVNDEFEGGKYVGTLENDGVGIAPFHDFEDRVDDNLQSELDELRQGIIDGEIDVAPDGA